MYDSLQCSNSSYWTYVDLFGKLFLIAGVLLPVIIWLVYALRKKVKYIKKIGFIPGIIVFALFSSGALLLLAKNMFGYLLIGSSMLLWTIFDRNIFPITLSVITIILRGVLKSDNRIVDSLLFILSFIFISYFIVAPVIKGKSKKEIFKILIPIILSLIFVIVGIGLSIYVSHATSSLGYCW